MWNLISVKAYHIGDNGCGKIIWSKASFIGQILLYLRIKIGKAI